jgi:hypothetical protein
MTIEQRVFWGTPLADSSSLENKLQEALLLDAVGKKIRMCIYIIYNIVMGLTWDLPVYHPT